VLAWERRDLELVAVAGMVAGGKLHDAAEKDDLAALKARRPQLTGAAHLLLGFARCIPAGCRGS
jgi:hypothetical protein